MKLVGINNIIIFAVIIACVGGIANAAAPGRCYECYARQLQTAIVEGNAAALEEIVGNSTLLGKQNMILAIGEDAPSFRSFMMESDVTIFVESVSDDLTESAIIAFVHSSSLSKRGLAGRKQVSSLRLFEDYLMCQVSFKDGRIRMIENFCFAETDVSQD